MLPGFLLLAAGIALAIWWWADFLLVLKGTLIFALLLSGLISLLVNISRHKAHREYAAALRDETGDAPLVGDTPNETPPVV